MAARLYDGAGAAAAGYLDRVVDPDDVIAEAMADARRLAELRTGAYVRTKQLVRQATIDHVLATLDDDIGTLSAPAPPSPTG